MGLVLEEMAMSRGEMVSRCLDLAMPFVEHWLKVYLASLPEASQSDKQTIPHWLSEMESSWAKPVSIITMKGSNAPLSLKDYVNLFLTPYHIPTVFKGSIREKGFPKGLAAIAEADGGKHMDDAVDAYYAFVARVKEALKGKPNVDWPELTIGAFKQVLPKEEQRDEPNDGSEEGLGRKPNPKQNPQPENSSLNEGGHAFGGLDVNEIVRGYIDEHEDEIVAKNKSREIEEEYDDCFHGANWDDEEDVAERYEDWVTRWHLDDYGELMALPLPKDGAECKARIADYAKYDIHHDETVFDTYAEEALEKYDVLYEDAVDDFGNRMYEFFDDPDSPLRKVYQNVGFSYDERPSRSWNAGRWPSVYFTVSITPLDDANTDWDGEEFDVRLSDGHPNGQGADDYEIEWQDYQGNEDALWKGFVKEFIRWMDSELDDAHKSDHAYEALMEDCDAMRSRLDEMAKTLKDARYYATSQSLPFIQHFAYVDATFRKDVASTDLRGWVDTLKTIATDVATTKVKGTNKALPLKYVYGDFLDGKVPEMVLKGIDAQHRPLFDGVDKGLVADDYEEFKENLYADLKGGANVGDAIQSRLEGLGNKLGYSHMGDIE